MSVLATAVLLCVSSMRAETSRGAENVRRIAISEGWKIKSIAPRAELDSAFLNETEHAAQDADWLDAGTMPATVHDILLRLGKIEAPWRPYGTEKCHWVGERDWVYAVRFPIHAARRDAHLVFRGVENKVDVYLNGKRLASHSSKLPLTCDVSGRLQRENCLVIHCHADLRQDDAQRCDRGTYLGPNPPIASVGVFDRVFVELSGGHRFRQVAAVSSVAESLTRATVTVDAEGVSRHDHVKIRLRLFDPQNHVAAEAIASAKVNEGVFTKQCAVTIDDPHLWWPRGYGDQPLYQAEMALMVQGQVHEIVTRTIGFRRITMPERLHFVVNGVPVFLRGGDWVTPNLMSDVWDTRRVDRLFALAENANFNAFRVWGPAEAPPDAFYEQADARGFLLWQDFTRLPMRSDSKSVDRCVHKARAQIRRLQHHPSILCWCGCNEAAMWAHEDYRRDFTDHGPWGGRVAAEAVGAVCKQLDPDRYYQPSTPFYGMNPNDPREGNTHGYTNMWFVPGYIFGISPVKTLAFRHPCCIVCNAS